MIKKIYKKTLGIVLAAAMMLSIAGCGSKEKEVKTDSTTAIEVSDNTQNVEATQAATEAVVTTAYAQTENEEFEKYIMDAFKEDIMSSTSSYHQNVKDLSSFGIERPTEAYWMKEIPTGTAEEIIAAEQKKVQDRYDRLMTFENAELTEEDMHKPFLTYEQFVAEKERLRESAIVDMPQREVIPEISKSVLEDERLQAEMEDKDVEQSEPSDYTIVQTESPDLSLFPTELSDRLVQRETASQAQDSLRNTESNSEKTVEKTVTKQDYQRMMDKEKAEWIGISLSDMPGSIRRFKSKMEQIGIWHESTLEMTETFMKTRGAAPPWPWSLMRFGIPSQLS